MDPVRSSLGAGVVATSVLGVVLFLADALFGGPSHFVFATFSNLCPIAGPPICDPGSQTATVVTLVFFVVLFAIAWPLVFGGFTWGLPGESGLFHGAVFGLVLWLGYVVTVLYWIGFGQGTLAGNLPLLLVTVVAYLVYGLVLGGVYDRLAAHRTLMSGELG